MQLPPSATARQVVQQARAPASLEQARHPQPAKPISTGGRGLTRDWNCWISANLHTNILSSAAGRKVQSARSPQNPAPMKRALANNSQYTALAISLLL
jgi:hypothetical protein